LTCDDGNTIVLYITSRLGLDSGIGLHPDCCTSKQHNGCPVETTIGKDPISLDALDGRATKDLQCVAA